MRFHSGYKLRVFVLRTATLSLLGGALGLPLSAAASDGTAAVGLTYYQQIAAGQSAAALESPASGVPTSLAIDNCSAMVEYIPKSQPDGSVHWEVLIHGFQRNAEHLNAVYDMVFVLPLPVTPSGTAAFTPIDSAILPQTGSPSAPAPLIYGGEQIVLKRDVGLEKSLLPGLVGDPSQGKLPSLAGTGYGYTLWDMIVQYDASYGASIQAWARFHYATSAAVSPPVASDSRMKAYLITWIPTLNSNIPPYAVRMAVQNPSAP